MFLRQPGSPGGGGDISLNFADTDIREVVAQILGTTLGQTYTIDPSVHGTATLRTAQPLSRGQLIPVLQTLLAQNGATLIQNDGVYRVLPTAAAGTSPGLAGSDANGVGASGTTVVPLRFASAEDLAKTLQPFVQNGGRIVADAGRNALVVSGDPATRQTLTSLVQAFDIDILAGQSYALLPVTSGDAKDFASALQDAVRTGGTTGTVRVIPMARINAVLVVSPQPQNIEQMRRIYGLVERKRRDTIRSWHVYYLQNSRSNDMAYVLQQAFTPGQRHRDPDAFDRLQPQRHQSPADRRHGRRQRADQRPNRQRHRRRRHRRRRHRRWRHRRRRHNRGLRHRHRWRDRHDPGPRRGGARNARRTAIRRQPAAGRPRTGGGRRRQQQRNAHHPQHPEQCPAGLRHPAGDRHR